MTQSASDERGILSWAPGGWHLVVVAALACVVYWPGLGGAWVFDDFSNIVDNASLRVHWDSGWEQWRDAVWSSASRDLPRPLAMLSFAVSHALHGLDPFWMKLTNLAIHLINSTLVFGLVHALLRTPAMRDMPESKARWVALWVAAAWALNPINLMAVLFVVQRMESLCHTFVFAGLWLYLDGRSRLQQTGRGWLRMSVGIAGGTGLGVLVKESAALLPVYAWLIEFFLAGRAAASRHDSRPVHLMFAALLSLALAAAVIRYGGRAVNPDAFSGRDFTLTERLMTEARVLVDYLHWTLLPDLGSMSLYHDAYPISRGWWSPPSTAASAILLALLLGIALAVRRRRPLTSLGILWFLSAHALTATVWPLELVFEHRNYFASLGVILVLADLLLVTPRKQRVRHAGMAMGMALLLVHAGATHLRAREWSDQLRFSSSEATKHPESPRAAYDLARNLVILSEFDRASPYFEPALDALERAMIVPGASPLPESAAILLAARSGVPVRAAWWASMKRKLESRHSGLAEIGALGSLSDCTISGECSLPRDEMVAAFLSALGENPHPRVLHDYGNYALHALKEPDLALALFEDAVARSPGEVIFRASLVRLYLAMGRRDEALLHLGRIRERDRWGKHGTMIDELERQMPQPNPGPAAGDREGNNERGARE